MATVTDREKALKLAAMRGIVVKGSSPANPAEVEFDLKTELAKNNIIIEGNVLEILEKNPKSPVYIERRADGKFVIAPPK